MTLQSLTTLGEYVFEQRLSVICINGTVVRISIQSNGSSLFCSNLNGAYPFVKQNINFIVIFNPDVIDGVATVNALNNNNEDIFYPKTKTSTDSIDQYLSRTQTNGVYHYCIGSSCRLDLSVDQTTTCNNIPTRRTSIANYITSVFINHKDLDVIGIAKDGHVIYGPYTSDDTLITRGFDIFNGMFFDSVGNYEYFVTSTFLYIIKCFDLDNYPDNLLTNCSENSTTHCIKSSYAEAFIIDRK